MNRLDGVQGGVMTHNHMCMISGAHGGVMTHNHI